MFSIVALMNDHDHKSSTPRDSKETHGRGRRYGRLFKLILTAGVLGFAAFQIDLTTVKEVLSLDTFRTIAITQIFLFSATALVAQRHSYLIRTPRAPFLPCLTAVLLSAGINLVTVARISEIVKATYLRQKLNVPLSNGTAAIVIERLFDVCVVTAIGLAGFTGVFLESNNILIVVLWTGILGLLLLRPASEFCLPFLEHRNDPISRFLHGNCQHVLSALSWKASAVTLLLTIGSWGVHYFAIWLFFFVQPGYELSFSQAALVFGAIIFASAIPSLPAGIGLFQAAVTFALTKMGIPFTEALLLSIVLHVAEIMISAISAPIILVLQPTGIGELLKRIPHMKHDPQKLS